MTILVLGGARSGKSRYALALAEKRWAQPGYIATAEVRDDEMAARVAAHRAQRGGQWRCFEEPLDLTRAMAEAAECCDGILIDCVTLWLSNVLLQEGEPAVEVRKQALMEALRSVQTDVILVSNEVGMGIVPEHRLGRVFRDLAGWLNQDLAALSETVVLVAAGLPVVLKGGFDGEPSTERKRDGDET